MGLLYPGFGAVDELSGVEVIDAINSSGADFLVTSLGSMKGQLWLKRNYSRLRIPVQAHFGASLKFEAGIVKSAPQILRNSGLEWLWRIKEEPFLWNRYWHDGKIFVHLLCANILPLAIYQLRIKIGANSKGVDVTEVHRETYLQIIIAGHATKSNVDKIIPSFRKAIAMRRHTIIDLSNTSAIDARVLGLILVLRKALKSSVGDPVLFGLSPELRRIFRLNGMEFLLAPEQHMSVLAAES